MNKALPVIFISPPHLFLLIWLKVLETLQITTWDSDFIFFLFLYLQKYIYKYIYKYI